MHGGEKKVVRIVILVSDVNVNGPKRMKSGSLGVWMGGCVRVNVRIVINNFD